MKFIVNDLYSDQRGNLSAVDNLPFDIKRFYTISNTKVGMLRGNHAHKKAKQILTCVSGCFTIYLDDGKEETEFLLKEKSPSLFISSPTWLMFKPTVDDSILLICSDINHDREEYIHDYNEFLKMVKK